MKNKTLVLGTALLVSSAFFMSVEAFYGAELTTPGKYKMTYEVDGQAKTVTVEVKPDQTEIKLKDTMIAVNEAWSPLTNIVSLKDKDGEPLALEKVTIKQNVDRHKAGTYFLTISYGKIESTAKISVMDYSIPTKSTRKIEKYSINDDKSKIMLNDELMKTEPRKLRPTTSGGFDQSKTTNFGEMLSFVSGTLLYGTRRK